MMPPLVFALPGNESMAGRLGAALEWESGVLETRNFPDRETYLRLSTDPKDRNVVLVCTLDRPDDKALRLLFAADAARDLGATSVGLVAPYLAYMRQDRRFQPGEAITSRTFARMVSAHFDWLVTVDPHLHRYASLDEVYDIEARIVRSAPLLSEWIRANVSRPFLIGPDVESEQWVSEVAGAIGAPWQVLRKTRYDDRNVEVAVPGLSMFAGHTPVIVDDIVSSGRTMSVTADQMREQGLEPPVLVAIHALFSEETYGGLKEKAAAVVSANSVVHPSNAIDLSAVLANAAAELAGGDPTITSNKEANRMNAYSRSLLAATAVLVASPAAAIAAGMTVYKTPWCGCCHAWAEAVEKAGYQASTVDLEDLSAIRKQAGVPAEMEGCHIAAVEGYFLEGHVPLEAIGKLLSERPDVAGLAVPGMPHGSLGMGDDPSASYEVYAVPRQPSESPRVFYSVGGE